jgi:hypothetical protein
MSLNGVADIADRVADARFFDAQHKRFVRARAAALGAW